MRFLIGMILLGTASAHTGFENQTEVRIYQDRMEMVVRTSLGLAWKILGERAPAAADDAGKVIARPLLAAEAQGLFDVTAGGVAMVSKSTGCVFEINRDVAFTLSYERPATWPLVLKARFYKLLGPLDSGTITVFDQTAAPYKHDVEPIAGKLIMAGDLSLSVTPGPVAVAATPIVPPASEPPTFGRFFLLGIEHILTGFDHLLFLLALLIGCRSLRSMLLIITAFTLAHSITLGLATFEVVNVPTRWVESFISLSIVYVGVENLVGKIAEKRRIWLIFGFGLIHGLGFASVLKGIGLGAGGQSILPPLLAFNLGVEAGQFAFVVVALPLLIHLRRSARFMKYGVPALSGLVIAAGLVWFFQRAFP